MDFEILLDILARDQTIIEHEKWNLTKSIVNKTLYNEQHEKVAIRLIACVPAWVLLNISVSLLVWLLGIQPKVTPKLFTFLHSFIVCRLTEYFAIQSHEMLLSRIGKASPFTVADETIIYTTLSFSFVQTLVFVFWPSIKELPGVCLNIVSFTSMVYCLQMNDVGCAEVVIIIWIIEFTNQFLHLGGILKDMKMRKTKLAVLNKILYFGSYLVLRIGLFAYVLYGVMMRSDGSVEVVNIFKLMVSIVYSSGLFFIFKIIFVVIFC